MRPRQPRFDSNDVQAIALLRVFKKAASKSSAFSTTYDS
jgi:hypothetical protein